MSDYREHISSKLGGSRSVLKIDEKSSFVKMLLVGLKRNLFGADMNAI